MASIGETITELTHIGRTIGEGRLQSINSKEKYSEAKSRLEAVTGQIAPEPLQTALEALIGAYDMGNQAQAMADQATAAIEQYVTAIGS